MAYNSSTDKQQVQYDVLTFKLDSTTNPKLVYKAMTTANKGLNPKFFSGNYTKIVNILNKFANDMKNKAIELGTNFVSNIITFISQLPGKIITFFVNVISPYSIGSSQL